MDLARAPRRRPLTARKKGSGYENANTVYFQNPPYLFTLEPKLLWFTRNISNVCKRSVYCRWLVGDISSMARGTRLIFRVNRESLGSNVNKYGGF